MTLYASGDIGNGAGATSLGSGGTDSGGNFTISGTNCPSGNPIVYLVARGGSVIAASFAGSKRINPPGPSGNTAVRANSGIALMATLGSCDSLANPGAAVINELTTVASTWALEQFSDSSGAVIGTSSTNSSGIANSGNLVGNVMVNVATGAAGSFWPADCAGTPSVSCIGLERMNTLANILAACVESSGPASSACSTLFSNTSSATDTLAAAKAMASNTLSNVSTLFALQSGAPPYTPALATAPGDLSLELTYSALHSLGSGSAVALDSKGDVFVAITKSPGTGTVAELPAGNYGSQQTFNPATAAINNPLGIAVDTAGNVFAANSGGGAGCSSFPSAVPCGSTSVLYAASSYLTGANLSGGVENTPEALTFDASGNLWIANTDGNSVIEWYKSSNYATGYNYVSTSTAQLDVPNALAGDSAGNVFVANFFGSLGVVEFPAGAPLSATSFTGIAGTTFGGVALDNGDNAWVSNFSAGNADSGAFQFTAASAYAQILQFTSADALYNQPVGIAVDGSANIWLGNKSGSSITELFSSGGYVNAVNLAPTVSGYLSFQSVQAIAIDASGNLWAANPWGVTQLLGMATPVLTPIEACLQKGQNVCLP